jgi:ribose transport system substrate-binding protein
MTTHAPAPEITPPSEPQPQPRRNGRWLLVFLIGIGAIAAAMYYSGAFQHKPKIAIVTASQGPYWDQIVRGATDAAGASNADVKIIRGAADEATQTQAIRDLVGQGYDGVGVSPNDPIRQAGTLSDLAAEASLITYDSDCPIAQRLCFIGTDNYDAGRMVGQQIRHAVPDGGEVIICVGSLEKDNGHRRRQGVIDELLDRPFEPARSMDPIDAPLKGPKYTIVATLVDGINADRATQLAAAAIDKHPNVKCFAGLFASNAPAILKALAQKNKLGKIQVVGFDFNEETLAGIEAGNVHATIMQDPYTIGYETVRILADLARGNRSRLPMFQTWHLTCDAVTKENIAAVRQKLAGTPKPPTTQPS